MSFSTDRIFEKRETAKSDWNGRIGSAALEVRANGDTVEFVLDGQVLPAASATYLMNFSLQSLQDAYAGAESLQDAIGNWQKKRDALIAGTIGIRSGEGVSAFQSVARQIVRALLKKKYGAKSAEWTGFIGLDDKPQNEKLDAIYVENEAAIKPAVEKEMERRRAEAEAKKDILGSIAI